MAVRLHSAVEVCDCVCVSQYTREHAEEGGIWWRGCGVFSDFVPVSTVRGFILFT